MKVKGTNRFLATHAILLACVSFTAPSMALACCPDDGQTTPKAATGLGDAFPPSMNLSTDPSWRVYEFERDGIHYVQINDATGNVRGAAGMISGTSWVMPIGSDADRIFLADDLLPAGRARVLYRARDVEVVLIEGQSRPRWIVRALPAR